MYGKCVSEQEKNTNLVLGLNYLLHPNQDIPPYINKNRIIKKVEKKSIIMDKLLASILHF